MIEQMGSTHPPVSYLTKYSIIKACGTIECSFKAVISDHQYHGVPPQIQNFIDEKFRNSSMNPNYGNIEKSLRWFDKEWGKNFKKNINAHEHKERILDSLNSLCTARNVFSHGQNPTASFSNVIQYFKDCVLVIEIIEKSLSNEVNAV